VAYDYLDLAAAPAVRAVQQANGSGEYWATFRGSRKSDRLTAAEAQFIAARDSFYLATVSESGWPYVQHRGGPRGFLHVLDERTLAFADFRGNRQYISTGNLAADDRAALILMDYAARRRLKLFVHMQERPLAEVPVLAESLARGSYKAVPERAFVLQVVAFDWNCPQHITRRFSEGEVAQGAAQLHAQLRDLEAENAALRARLSALEEAHARS
jgi:predicted pyridoxine 5'-phosphate oxidase superfamily flavin-nucleotide-binding protein